MAERDRAENDAVESVPEEASTDVTSAGGKPTDGKSVVADPTGDGDTTAPRTPPLSRSNVFDTLSNPRRRCVLHYLKRNDGVATAGEMAATIAAWEDDIPVSAVDSQARKRVYTSLYQVHLPNMDESGFVDYDCRAGSVSLLPRAAELDVHMEIVGENDIPWSQFYLGLSSLFGLVAVLSALSVAPVVAVAAGVWNLVFGALFLATSAVHVYRSRASSIWAGDRPAEMRVAPATEAPADD
jgi:hypothetical protein